MLPLPEALTVAGTDWLEICPDNQSEGMQGSDEEGGETP